MPRVNSRRKGRRGETKAKHLLLDRNFTILADTTAGITQEKTIKTAISEAVTANPAFLDIRVIIQNHSLYNIISLLIY